MDAALAPRLLGAALAVRCTYLAAIAVLSGLLADYDTSAGLLSDACTPDWPQRVAAGRGKGATPLVVWDAIYFDRIAVCGYEFEQFHAFFPGYPALIGRLATAVHLGKHGFLIAGLAVNVLAFLLSVFCVLRVGQAVLRDDRLAASAALIFALNPASVFHATLYTESVFGAATLLGLYLLYCRDAPLAAAVSFAASSSVRSNGILNAGFLLHHAGSAAIDAWRSSKARSVVLALQGALGTAITTAPYAAFQYAGYLRYCEAPLPGGAEPRPWCAARVPSLYGYVQDHYWGVGLFKYWRLSQVPNFLLAAPTLALSAWGIYSYAAAQPLVFATGGLLRGLYAQRERCSTPPIAGVAYTPLRQRQQEVAKQRRHGAQTTADGIPSGLKQRSGPVTRSQAAAGAASALAAVRSVTPPRQPSPLPNRRSGGAKWGSSGAPPANGSTGRSGYHRPEVAVFVYQWAFMALVGLLVMHVQVSTRFLSTCPPWYWFAAHLLRVRPSTGPWLWAYCLAYMALGAVLFPNFMPWT